MLTAVTIIGATLIIQGAILITIYSRIHKTLAGIHAVLYVQLGQPERAASERVHEAFVKLGSRDAGE